MQTAFVPKRVQPSLQSQGRFTADMFFKNFAIMPHVLENVVCPLFTQTQILPHTRTYAQKALDGRIFGFEVSIDIVGTNAKFFPLNEGVNAPLDNVEPLVISVADGRTQGFFGNGSGQYEIVLGILEPAPIGCQNGRAPGYGIAPSADKSIEGLFVALEDDGFELDAISPKVVGHVQLYGRTLLGADSPSLKVFGFFDTVFFAHHKSLAVIENGRGEIESLRSIPPQCPTGNTAEDINFPGLQGDESGLGREGDIFDFVRISQDSRADGPTDIHIKSNPFSLGVGRRKPLHSLCHPTYQVTSFSDLGQCSRGTSIDQKQKTCKKKNELGVHTLIMARRGFLGQPELGIKHNKKMYPSAFSDCSFYSKI